MKNNFGAVHANQAIKMLKKILEKDYPLNHICHISLGKLGKDTNVVIHLII